MYALQHSGIVENYAAFDYPFDRIKRLYDINVHGAFFTAREAARHMIPLGGGSIVLVASMSANVSTPVLLSPHASRWPPCAPFAVVVCMTTVASLPPTSHAIAIAIAIFAICARSVESWTEHGACYQ